MWYYTLAGFHQKSTEGLSLSYNNSFVGGSTFCIVVMAETLNKGMWISCSFRHSLRCSALNCVISFRFHFMTFSSTIFRWQVMLVALIFGVLTETCLSGALGNVSVVS